MKTVDLHTHTTASDGKHTPYDQVRLAKEKGLCAVAITDHDTVSGIEEALEAGEEQEIEVVPGVEISTLYKGQDIHILGYYLSYDSPRLEEELQSLRDTRQLRNKMMLERLNELGIQITMEEVAAKQERAGGNIGRPHMAEVLMDKGIVQTMEEAFETFLGKEGKAYVNPPRISPVEGVQLIQRHGGIPVLAHPGLYDQDDLITDLVKEGLKGIEVYHPDHSPEDVQRYEEIAEQMKLLKTGGSDYHGVRNGIVFHGELGSQEVAYELLASIKRALEQRKRLSTLETVEEIEHTAEEIKKEL